jgi:hypothetical protein
MLKKLVFVLFFLLVFMGIYAEGFQDINKAKKTIENAIDVFTNQNFEDGTNILKPYWPLNPDSLDSLATQAKQQWKIINDNYGKKVSVEYIRTDTIGKSLIKFIHIVKLEKYALRFETTLYNSPNGWIITSFNYDDKVNELFKN